MFFWIRPEWSAPCQINSWKSLQKIVRKLLVHSKKSKTVTKQCVLTTGWAKFLKRMIWDTECQRKNYFLSFFLLEKFCPQWQLNGFQAKAEFQIFFCVKHQVWKPTSICTSGWVISLVVGFVGNANVKKITTFSHKTVQKAETMPRCMETAQNWKNFDITCLSCWLDKTFSPEERICTCCSHCNFFKKMF